MAHASQDAGAAVAQRPQMCRTRRRPKQSYRFESISLGMCPRQVGRNKAAALLALLADLAARRGCKSAENRCTCRRICFLANSQNKQATNLRRVREYLRPVLTGFSRPKTLGRRCRCCCCCRWRWWCRGAPLAADLRAARRPPRV